jgi:hypothetical protein
VVVLVVVVPDVDTTVGWQPAKIAKDISKHKITANTFLITFPPRMYFVKLDVERSIMAK